MDDVDKHLFEIYIKRIETIDKNISLGFFKMLTFFLSIYALILTTAIPVEIVRSFSGLLLVIIGLAVSILFSLYMVMQQNKHIDDLYETLIDAVKNHKLKKIHIKEMTSMESLYYKRKYTK